MEERLTVELTKIFKAITILSPTSFSFAGQVAPQLDPATQHMHGFPVSQNPLLSQLQLHLYQHCYVRRFKGDLEPPPQQPTQPDNLLQMLSEANASRERWDSGWRIHRTLPSGQIMAHKHGLSRLLWAGEFVNHDGPGRSPVEGSNISIFLPRESRTLQPGFYFTFGEAVTDQQDEYNVVRFYWNVNSDDASKLVGLITKTLNRFQIPFRLKCPSSTALYGRIDTAVLYIGYRFYRITAELLVDVHQEIRDELQPDTPMFTRRLARGLALAEDPGNGESFGMNRCRIVAEAIWKAYENGSQSEQARLEEVVKQFESYGLSIEHPYLNPRSINQYDFPEWRG